MPTPNRQITLAARPVGMPKESDFRLAESPMPLPGGGVALGEGMGGGGVGRVVESNDPRHSAGDTVEGMLGWQEYAVAPGRPVREIDASAGPISSALYVLGMPGLTAYFGLLEICRPHAGETVVVSGAARAVGSAGAQIARIK